MAHALQNDTNIIRRSIAALAGVLCIAACAAAAPTAAEAATTEASYAPHVDRHIIPTRAKFLGRQRTTWYGPGFFGRRTACGQTLRPNTWGIAHRTLPCGTLVTLVRGSKRVSVRVIDRGPFSGATVDLTSRTKEFLGFTDGHVAMSRVSKFRFAASNT